MNKRRGYHFLFSLFFCFLCKAQKDSSLFIIKEKVYKILFAVEYKPFMWGSNTGGNFQLNNVPHIYSYYAFNLGLNKRKGKYWGVNYFIGISYQAGNLSGFEPKYFYKQPINVAYKEHTLFVSNSSKLINIPLSYDFYFKIPVIEKQRFFNLFVTLQMGVGVRMFLYNKQYNVKVEKIDSVSATGAVYSINQYEEISGEVSPKYKVDGPVELMFPFGTGVLFKHKRKSLSNKEFYFMEHHIGIKYTFFHIFENSTYLHHYGGMPIIFYNIYF